MINGHAKTPLQKPAKIRPVAHLGAVGLTLPRLLLSVGKYLHRPVHVRRTRYLFRSKGIFTFPHFA
jgi:hypothetical protein